MTFRLNGHRTSIALIYRKYVSIFEKEVLLDFYSGHLFLIEKLTKLIASGSISE